MEEELIATYDRSSACSSAPITGYCYHVIMVTVERVQTGVRIDRQLLKVLKALAEYLDLSLGDLLEGIVLHVFEQKLPFDEETIATIGNLNRVYGMKLSASDSHHLIERDTEQDAG